MAGLVSGSLLTLMTVIGPLLWWIGVGTASAVCSAAASNRCAQLRTSFSPGSRYRNSPSRFINVIRRAGEEFTSG
ncbi:hypothetical protein [Micromonospora aurantiaca]|uniref:Secreted protein n=1 Tax=Micromonospora aurantiaca (nom. illeg.) TaxID=47850 RepID=A0ABQ6UCU8_9ACTN|nr:hypothetical protein [Micromonospora aurantiaca]KAB1108842.1 hypothetical protein F6X54_21045 [Micromonospora aurantiaca]UFN95783.1 hypothetical protein LF814_06390 [Micromonospora aurantiaca]